MGYVMCFIIGLFLGASLGRLERSNPYMTKTEKDELKTLRNDAEVQSMRH